MKRFRQWFLSIAIALALLVRFGPVASADPNDGGGFGAQSSSSWDSSGAMTTSADPNDGGGY
jgi:hypothetical protein